MGSLISKASSTSSAASGGQWKKKLIFCRWIDGKLKEKQYDQHNFVTKMRGIIGIKQSIINVTAFASKLSEIQITTGRLYHMFIEFKTRDWWWTIEKCGDGIIFQRDRNYEKLRKFDRGEERKTTNQLNQSPGRFTILDLVKWLYKRKEIENEYNLVTSNCQHFGNAVYEFVTGQPAIEYGDPQEFLLHCQDPLLP